MTIHQYRYSKHLPKTDVLYKDDTIIIDWIHGACIDDENMAIFYDDKFEQYTYKGILYSLSNPFKICTSKFPYLSDTIKDKSTKFISLVEKKYNIK